MTENEDFYLDDRLDQVLQRMIKVKIARRKRVGVEAYSSQYTTREELLMEANSPQAVKKRDEFRASQEMFDNENIAPSQGLSVTRERIVSFPDENIINLQIIKPLTKDNLPCIYYIHGGGMATYSCFDGVYRAWGKIIAAKGAVVVMVDFRNSLNPSSVPEVAPFPAGLNDCVSGLEWVQANSAALNIRSIVVAGESGGGNLALAVGLKLKRDGRLHLLQGIYSMCPFLDGDHTSTYPSRRRTDGIYISLAGLRRTALAYGIDALRARDPLAWPCFATAADVTGLPPVVISVNQCDALRDEGVAFAELLVAAGVPARLREVAGTCHAAELLLFTCPRYGHDTARDLVAFAAGLPAADCAAASGETAATTTKEEIE